jgi:hypothetical protein
MACFSLAGSKSCPELNSVRISPISRTALGIDYNVDSVATFDRFLASRIDFTPSVLATTGNALQCRGWNGRELRYRMSTYCFYLVSKYSGSCPGSTLPAYCQKSCNDFVNSSKAAFANATVCDQRPTPAVQSLRSNFTQQQQSFCDTLPRQDCMDGIRTDKSQCGFYVKDDFTNYCKFNSEDSCCQKLPSGVVAAREGGLSTGLIAGIAVGAVAGLALLGALAFFVYKKFSNKRSSLASYGGSRKGPDVYSQNITEVMQQQPRHTQSIYEQKMSPLANSRQSHVTDVRASELFGADRATRNTRVQVFENYRPHMDDEMQLTVGDVVMIHEQYEDGIGI